MQSTDQNARTRITRGVRRRSVLFAAFFLSVIGAIICGVWIVRRPVGLRDRPGTLRASAGDSPSEAISGPATPFDELGIDVLLTGSQKALALPPGLALFAASKAAFTKAESINDRGYYFDFLEFRKNQEKNMTPSTPCIPHIFALRSKLEEIFAEGLENRYARHAKLNAMVHEWVTANGFEFFAPEGFRSKSLTCVKNNKDIDLPKLIELLRGNHGLTIDTILS